MENFQIVPMPCRLERISKPYTLFFIRWLKNLKDKMIEIDWFYRIWSEWQGKMGGGGGDECRKNQR